MIIALRDDAARERRCEVETEPEHRFILDVDGFAYVYERRRDAPCGMPVYYLIDAEATDGLGGEG